MVIDIEIDRGINMKNRTKKKIEEDDGNNDDDSEWDDKDEF